MQVRQQLLADLGSLQESNGQASRGTDVDQ